MNKLLIFIFFFLYACDGDGKLIPEHKVLAKINNNILSSDFIDTQIPLELSPEEKNEIKRKLIHRWIDRNLIYLDALASGIQLSEVQDFQISELKKELIVETYINNKLQSIIDVSDREITDYFTLHKEEFTNAVDKIHLVHLFLNKLDNTLNQAIFDSKNLLDVIKQYRLEQLSGNERIIGDLGIIELSQLNAEFRIKCQSANENEIIGPFKYQNEIHYLQILKHFKKGQTLDINQVKDTIKSRVLAERKEKIKKDLIEKLKSNYIIENNLQ
jgi:hypothetical protein